MISPSGGMTLDVRLQQVPPQPRPDETPVPPIVDPNRDPTEHPPPVEEPEIDDPTPTPDAPPMIAEPMES